MHITSGKSLERFAVRNLITWLACYAYLANANQYHTYNTFLNDTQICCLNYIGKTISVSSLSGFFLALRDQHFLEAMCYNFSHNWWWSGGFAIMRNMSEKFKQIETVEITLNCITLDHCYFQVTEAFLVIFLLKYMLACNIRNQRETQFVLNSRFHIFCDTRLKIYTY